MNQQVGEVELLPPFGGGHYLTTVTSHAEGNLIVQCSPKEPKVLARYSQLLITGLSCDLHHNYVDYCG